MINKIFKKIQKLSKIIYIKIEFCLDKHRKSFKQNHIKKIYEVIKKYITWENIASHKRKFIPKIFKISMSNIYLLQVNN